MDTDRKTIMVGDSFHHKVYRYWVKLGGKPKERESLCHYFWTVVLYTWLRAAVIWAPSWAPWLAPIMVIGGAAAVAGIIWSVDLALVLGLYALGMGAFGHYMLTHDEAPAWVDRADVWLEKHGKAVGIGFLTAVVIAIATCLIIWTVTTLEVLGIAVGLVVVGIGLTFLCLEISDRWKSRDHAVKGDSALTVTKEFIVAKKHRICPFIEFADDEKVPVPV